MNKNDVPYTIEENRIKIDDYTTLTYEQAIKEMSDIMNKYDIKSQKDIENILKCTQIYRQLLEKGVIGNR